MNPEQISWLFIPSAILLGSLHGLEPGHSKTMMASFIIATRGTITQAVLLGVSAAFSHSLVIWALAALALRFGSKWNVETVEPYLQLFSAAAIVALAIWMFRRTKAEVDAAHHHGHGHDREHHHDETKVLDTGHGKIILSIHEDGVPPVFQLRAPKGSHLPSSDEIRLTTQRSNGTKQGFSLVAKKGYLESQDIIPEPHEFTAEVEILHGNHSHTVMAVFSEDGHHHLAEKGEDFQDAHERAHAEDIKRRFEGRSVTTPQIVWFGITGGLMPCPAAFSVLLICLQLKRVTLGFFMVAAFSLGLALTMVTTGVIAAWSVRHAERKFKGFGEVMRRAPYFSCALMIAIATVMAWHGWQGLNTQ